LAQMQVSEKRISPVVMELSIEVPANLVKAEVDKAYVTLGKKAFVKGFRPGKAPRDVLTRLFNPQVQAKGVDPKQPFSFTARFEVQPDIESVKFEGFELWRPKVEVDEKAVEEQLEGLRQRHAALKAPEPARPAQKGDVLSIDFTLSVVGVEFKKEGGQGV